LLKLQKLCSIFTATFPTHYKTSVRRNYAHRKRLNRNSCRIKFEREQKEGPQRLADAEAKSQSLPY
jgi:hypothetical protein